MNKYIVAVREVHIHLVEVNANSLDDAKDRVRNGEGNYLDNTLEYSHTLDSETWTVEEAEKIVK